MKKRVISLVATICLVVASMTSLIACGQSSSENTTIKIGVFNNAGWTTEQANLWINYEEYLTKNLTNEDGTPVFEFVHSTTTTLADEVSSFIAQGVDGIMIANSDATSAIESTCAADKVPYVVISGAQSSSTVGENPSDYCVGGMDPFFGDTKAFAQQWMDYIEADMTTQGLDNAVVSAICFPKGFSPMHDEIIAGMQELSATDAYSNITIGAIYYAGGVPLANYIPAVLTTFQSDILDSSSEAYGTNYLLGFANGMGTMVTTLNEQYGVAGQPLENVKMLAVGYTPNTLDALQSYILTEAEVGLEGFVSGIVRLYNQINGVTYTDAADYTNDSGIINVPTSWFIINSTNYEDFQTYVLGGGSWDFDTYTPGISADEVKALLGATKLADIEAITNRTLDEIKAAHQ